MDVNIIRYDDWMDRNEDFLEDYIMTFEEEIIKLLEEADCYRCVRMNDGKIHLQFNFVEHCDWYDRRKEVLEKYEKIKERRTN